MPRHLLLLIISTLFFSSFLSVGVGDAFSDEPNWWMTPHRMLQTNLREVDATMDTDLYVREVQDFGANVVLFSVGGIVANYPTALPYHWRNTYMESDLVGTVLPKLHAANIKMIGRFDFSKINEQFAAKHSDWLYVNEQGQNVNYNGQVHTCLMGGYQQDYMFKILDEAVMKYPLDGVFFNMIGFPQTDYSRVHHGVCQCENCKSSFKAFCGLDLPKHDGDAKALTKLKAWQRAQIDAQFRRVRELVKSIRPNIAICTYTEEHIDVIRKESGQPIGEGHWGNLERAQSTLMKNPTRQLANASNHFHQMIFRHSGVAPYLHTRRLWQLMMSGAWLDFYCMGPLQRLEDRAGLGPAGDVYRFHAANDQWLLDTESAADVGLVYHAGEDFAGWVQMLSESHVPFDLVSVTDSELNRYQTLVVPQSDRLHKDDARILDPYVARGGRLLLSGKVPESLTCTGSPKLIKTWPERHSMYLKIRPEDKQLIALDALKDYDLSHLRGEFHEYAPVPDSQTLLRLVHDVTYGPPEKCYIHSISDIPGMWYRKHGQGAALVLPYEIGRMYAEWGSQTHALLAVGSIDQLLKTPRRASVETSPLVEVTHRRDREGRFEWVGLLNHTGQLAASIHAPVPIPNVTVHLKTSDRVKQIRGLTDGSALQHHQEPNGQETITLPQLNEFEIVLVEYAD
ncbi:alpha-amylase family protein [Novipirellula artificiosorum]|uniref:Beta-galactosidase trimerization domain protein n=1 Tax=Novipirellula artificiosorum TaxID=2528016 RepID=A0A5C6D6C0_9BACT|nr:alpha-amylase family protein [Novipirellula artificiosorum]TWU32472.1 Beta-galactosidase trimerization domain protein [Novipirellula artificiosorum]